MNAGDAHLVAFPRFYVDADILLPAGALGRLRDELHENDMELVLPRVDYDTTGASKLARYVSEISGALPHGKAGGFHCVLGSSAAGRAR